MSQYDPMANAPPVFTSRHALSLVDMPCMELAVGDKIAWFVLSSFIEVSQMLLDLLLLFLGMFQQQIDQIILPVFTSDMEWCHAPLAF